MQTRVQTILSALLVLAAGCTRAVAQYDVAAPNSPQSNAENPLVLGHGVGLFKVGPLLAADDFENLDRNETEYPIVLESSASGNTVVSLGPVTDLGTDNNVSRFRQLKSSEHCYTSRLNRVSWNHLD